MQAHDDVQQNQPRRRTGSQCPPCGAALLLQGLRVRFSSSNASDVLQVGVRDVIGHARELDVPVAAVQVTLPPCLILLKPLLPALPCCVVIYSATSFGLLVRPFPPHPAARSCPS